MGFFIGWGLDVMFSIIEGMMKNDYEESIDVITKPIYKAVDPTGISGADKIIREIQKDIIESAQ